MAEDTASVTNLLTEKSTLSEQVALYANRISPKNADRTALYIVIKNLQVEVKNLKAEVAKFKWSSHSGGVGATKNKRLRPEQKWKREGRAHHPTW